MYRQISKTLIALATVKIINIALVFMSSVLLARILGPEDYGNYVFIMSLIGTLALISYLGMPEFLTREIVKFASEQEWQLLKALLRTSGITAVGASVLLVVIVGFATLTHLTTEPFNRWSLLLISLPMLPAIALSQLIAATLKGFHRVLLAAIPDLIVRPSLLLIAIVILDYTSGLSTASVLTAHVLVTYFSLLTAVLLYQSSISEKLRNVPATSKETDKFFAKLLPFSGLAAVSFFNVEFLNIFLGISSTSDDIALFKVSASIALFVALPLTLVEAVISPKITSLYKAGNLEELERLTKFVSLISLLTSIIPAGLFVIYGSSLIAVIFGSEYVEAYYITLIIMLGYVVVSMIGLSMQLLYATAYQAEAFQISLLGAVVTIFASLILIPVLGALGAGIVLGLGKAMRAALFMRKARKCLNIKTSIIW